MKDDTSLMGLLPGETHSLKLESEQIIQAREDFYAYINGGAELYLNYGFHKLAKRNYLFEETYELKAEVFDMGSPANAFGVFSYSKDTANIDLGQGGQQMGSSLIFWQDRYFVSIFAHQERDEIKDQMIRMGRSISKAIGKEGALPPVFKIIPEESLVSGSTFYFHHHAWQNKYRYISNDNVFNIDEHVHALLNQYGDPGNRYFFLMVEYPSVQSARKAYKKATGRILPYLRRHRTVENDRGEWMGCEVKDKLLMFVLDAPSRQKATYLLEQTAENYLRLTK
ncbi:MAG: hypothetical protein KGY60_01515 [Bacteroidales bacterium]|nr:hypothetical protein [Bacteroidales bacterium]